MIGLPPPTRVKGVDRQQQQCDVNTNYDIIEKYINNVMSSKTVMFNQKKNHKGNDWITGDLSDLINLKKTDYYK